MHKHGSIRDRKIRDDETDEKRERKPHRDTGGEALIGGTLHIRRIHYKNVEFSEYLDEKRPKIAQKVSLSHLIYEV